MAGLIESHILTLLTGHADLNLDNLEFSALPSGLHLVEQDVVYGCSYTSPRYIHR